MRLNLHGVCRACILADRGKDPEAPFFYSAENNLDFRDVPDHLPQLIQLEEILIAWVHISIQVFQYRGQQYKYRGHVISFFRDVGKIYT